MTDPDRIDAELQKLMTALGLKAVALVVLDEATDVISLYTGGMCVHTAQDCMAEILDQECDDEDEPCEINHGVN